MLNKMLGQGPYAFCLPSLWITMYTLSFNQQMSTLDCANNIYYLIIFVFIPNVKTLIKTLKPKQNAWLWTSISNKPRQAHSGISGPVLGATKRCVGVRCRLGIHPVERMTDHWLNLWGSVVWRGPRWTGQRAPDRRMMQLVWSDVTSPA